MRPFTNAEMLAIYEGCIGVMKTYESRHGDANGMTLNEAQAVNTLKHALTARERDALEAAMGTAV